MGAEIGEAEVERGSWQEAYDLLSAADAAGDLSGAELDRFGLAAQVLGNEEDAAAIWERAHRKLVAEGNLALAARCAHWLGMLFMQRNEMAHAGGWWARARQHAAGLESACAEQGLVLLPGALQMLFSGSPSQALEGFETANLIARQFADEDGIALSTLGIGQCLVRVGDVPGGMARLDDAMLSVIGGHVRPVVAGIVYCSVIETCQGLFDLARAQEWTDALTRWCERHRGMRPFRGSCQVYRAELLRIHGEFTAALEAAQEAERLMTGPPLHPAAGDAYYQEGEVHRIRGAHDRADAAFRRAEELGRQPEPGRALLRLAQGRTGAAATAIRHALNETPEGPGRPLLLGAAVDIFLAENDTAGAGEAAQELQRLADASGFELVRALAERAHGTCALAASDAAGALRQLRASLRRWQTLDAPFETARTQVLIGGALQASGDAAAGDAQIALAREAFARLGAHQTLADAGEQHPGGETAFGLTPRELEVLRLLATGMTNRAIAMNLTISEKTVANHVASILGKLELSSRAAATAFAYEHRLV